MLPEQDRLPARRDGPRDRQGDQHADDDQDHVGDGRQVRQVLGAERDAPIIRWPPSVSRPGFEPTRRRLGEARKEIADGSVNLETGEFVLFGTIEGGGVTVTLTQRGRFTSETSYTAETTILVQAQFIGCEMRTADSGTR